jgi:hypothetical protein
MIDEKKLERPKNFDWKNIENTVLILFV